MCRAFILLVPCLAVCSILYASEARGTGDCIGQYLDATQHHPLLKTGTTRPPIGSRAAVTVPTENGPLVLRSGTIVSIKGLRNSLAVELERMPAKVLEIYSGTANDDHVWIELLYENGKHVLLSPRQFKSAGGRLASEKTRDTIRRVLAAGKNPFPDPGPARSIEVDMRVSRYSRNFPRVGQMDTVFMSRDGGLRGLHQDEINFFGDAEILTILPATHKIGFAYGDKKVPIPFTADGKSVIQQQGIRGCTAATTAMLIADRGGVIDFRDVMETNLGHADSQVNALKKAGFKPLHYSVELNLPRLNQMLQKNGPAIVSVGGEIGNHVVIVDQVDLVNKTVTLRDPWHGWQITVTDKAFRRRINSQYTDVIQIERQIDRTNPSDLAK